MSETPKVPSGFRIDRGDNGGLITFATRDELIQYFSDEQNYFQWLREPLVIKRFSFGNSLAGHQNQFFNNWRKAATDTQNRTDDALRKELIKAGSDLANFVALSKDSPRASFIEDLRQHRGPIIAAGAYLCMVPNLTAPLLDQIPTEIAHGMFLGYQFREHLSNDSITAQNALFKKTTEDIRQELADLKAENAKAAKLNSWLTKKIAWKYQAIGRVSRKTSEKWDKANSAIVKEAVDRLDQTNSTYKQFMQLQAPVGYWTTKATEHSKKLTRWGWICSGYAALVMLAIILMALCGVPALSPLLELKSDQPPTIAPIVLGALGLTALTIVFWFGRIIVRIYLSEHHLAIDARFRATMTQTYLALTNEGKSSEGDRNIILTAIFRPTTDGIIKDDAAPFMSWPLAISEKMSR